MHILILITLHTNKIDEFLHFNPPIFVNINNSLTLTSKCGLNVLNEGTARKSIMSVEETESVATRFSRYKYNSHTWATFFIFIQHFQLAHERGSRKIFKLRYVTRIGSAKIDKYKILEYECLLNFNL